MNTSVLISLVQIKTCNFRLKGLLYKLQERITHFLMGSIKILTHLIENGYMHVSSLVMLKVTFFCTWNKILILA